MGGWFVGLLLVWGENVPSSQEPQRKVLVRRKGPVGTSRGDDGVEEPLFSPASAVRGGFGASWWVFKGGWRGLCAAGGRTPVVVYCAEMRMGIWEVAGLRCCGGRHQPVLQFPHAAGRIHDANCS